MSKVFCGLASANGTDSIVGAGGATRRVSKGEGRHKMETISKVKSRQARFEPARLLRNTNDH